MTTINQDIQTCFDDIAACYVDKPCADCDRLKRILAKLEAFRETLKYYAEPFTWARVVADYRAGVDLNKMFGRQAREVLGEDFKPNEEIASLFGKMIGGKNEPVEK